MGQKQSRRDKTSDDAAMSSAIQHSDLIKEAIFTLGRELEFNESKFPLFLVQRSLDNPVMVGFGSRVTPLAMFTDKKNADMYASRCAVNKVMRDYMLSGIAPPPDEFRAKWADERFRYGRVTSNRLHPGRPVYVIKDKESTDDVLVCRDGVSCFLRHEPVLGAEMVRLAIDPPLPPLEGDFK